MEIGRILRRQIIYSNLKSILLYIIILGEEYVENGKII